MQKLKLKLKHIFHFITHTSLPATHLHRGKGNGQTVHCIEMSEIWEIQLVEITPPDQIDWEWRTRTPWKPWTENFFKSVSIQWDCITMLNNQSLSFLDFAALLCSDQYWWDRLFSQNSNGEGTVYHQYHSHRSYHPRQCNSRGQGKTQSEC